MALAAAEGRILLSADTDFGELLAAAGGVARIPAVLDNLDQLVEFLQAGAIVVLTERRIRVRLRSIA